MTLTQLIQAAQAAQLQYGAEVEVIVRERQRAGTIRTGIVNEWDLSGLEVEIPLPPWDGGETVVVLRVEG